MNEDLIESVDTFDIIVEIVLTVSSSSMSAISLEAFDGI
jgi:hypothetical protein